MIGISSKITELALGGEREKLVCAIRERFGGSQAYKPRLDVRDLCRNVGIPITETTFDAVAALAVRDRKGRIEVAIALSAALAAEEQRFTLAHLLGHFFLHVQPKLAAGEWSMDGFKEGASAQARYVNRVVARGMRTEDRQRDSEADAFAAALLMPVGPLKRALDKLVDQDHVAAFFGVAPQLLARRLEDLSGLEPEPRSFTEAEDRLDQLNVTRARVIKAGTPPSHVPPVEPLAGKMDLSKVQRVIANAGYKADVSTASTKASADDAKKPRKGMEMLRDLARKIDSSVD